jgi:heme-degrading monooxygenase HmoA
MSYIIDVISGGDRAHVATVWHDQAQRLATLPGFLHAELYAKQRDVGDAHYDFVAVHRWKDGKARQGALDSGLAAASFDGLVLERATCELTIELSEFSLTEGDAIWLINPFEIEQDQIADVTDMWDKAKDHMVSQRGFVNARLFRATGTGDRYRLINVAQWQSAELFMAALNNRSYDQHRERSRKYKLHPSLCSRVGLVVAERREQADQIAVEQRS